MMEKMDNLFQRLQLEGMSHTLKPADVLQITAHSLQSHDFCAEDELVQTFINKLLMMNYRARYIKIKDNKEDITQQEDSEEDFDIFNEMSLSKTGTSQYEQVHPMDVQMAAFHFVDDFLKQLMVTKLSQCQYALPLLVPDPAKNQIEFPLWTFRQINKSWKMRTTKSSKIQPIYKAETPMVFFFRFGSVSSSKSQLMNSLINERHNTFFHRNCPGSSRTRVLMDGVVEITWFCPSGKDTDKFTDCVAFCNLHGDAGDHEKQLQILTEKALVNVVLLPRLDRNDRYAEKLQSLSKIKEPLIFLLTEDESTLIQIRNRKYKIGLKDRNQSDVSEDLKSAINDCLSEPYSPFRLEDLSKHCDITVDEEKDNDCRRGKEAAMQLVSLLKDKGLTEIKGSFLPHQGKLWHQWCQKNKELHQPQGEEIEMEISKKKTEMKKLREQQHKIDISEFFNQFINEMGLDVKHKMFFLKWLGILLDEHTSTGFAELHHRYDEKWSTVLKLKGNRDTSEQLKAEQNTLEKMSEELEAATFGLEHIMREIGQIYESCSSVKENKKNLLVHFSSLPSLAAEMMISGFPLELMDGDAGHVPVTWISAVLDEVIQNLSDQRIFVLSVLGLQSSGKSTLLNTMFGLQFAVSAGRCTRGAFMQLVKVSDEMKTELKFDYILVVDTEGLCALELAGRSTRHHDNELATFVVGLANLTLINIFGENPAEMQDILQIVVQAFLRMKNVKLNPSCVFVHQNVSDVTAGDKNMEGRRRLQKTLDEITKLTAEEEDCNIECFSEVIRFDVQNDVKYFAQFWEGSPPMAAPNPHYSQNIQELKETIISHASKSQGLMLKDLDSRIKDLWEALMNERFVFSFRNSLEISAYRKLETKYSKWSWSLRKVMLETENKLLNQIENEAVNKIEEMDFQTELKKTSEKVKKSMSEFFEKQKDKFVLIQWKTSFEKKITQLQENIVRETKRKLNEVLQQQDLNKRIDDLRRRHENTLYEKSKELSLKLKHKANDEETLKKEFNLLWKQCLKKFKSDTSVIREISILNDAGNILNDRYNKETKKIKNLLMMPSYSEYVIFKKSTNNRCKKTATDTVKETDETLTSEDEACIRTLVTNGAQQIKAMIQSFNISKIGYNISYIQQVTDYIKKSVKEFEKGEKKYEFTNEFFVDLVYFICKRSKKVITDQHRLFREANDPVIYFENKKEEYYSIFQKYCHETTSATIFSEIICQKLKGPIEQSVYKKTARDLMDEIKSNCPSLNGNRSNLEKHILITLADVQEFDKYMQYIHSPRDHFESFIRDTVSQYIKDKFEFCVLPNMKKNIKILQHKIIEAANTSTKHVQLESGGSIQPHGLWLKRFTQQLSDDLIFSEKDFSGVKHDGVDVNLLENVIKKNLHAIVIDIVSRFNTQTFPENLDYKFRPDAILTDHFCQCCWEKCPFCGVTCTNTIVNHDRNHSAPLHRVIGLNNWIYKETKCLSIEICTSAVASQKSFHPSQSNDSVPWKKYKKAGGVYAAWEINPDHTELPYWKWFVCRFQKDLEKYYNKTFEGCIPDEWRIYSEEEAKKSLDQYI